MTTPPLKPGDRVLVSASVDYTMRDGRTFCIAFGNSWLIDADAWRLPLDEATVERLAEVAHQTFWRDRQRLRPPLEGEYAAVWHDMVRDVIAALIEGEQR